jgi:nucleoside-diphosphate-sugar epimerase
MLLILEVQYGIMKLAGEWLTRDYTRKTGMGHVIIRPSAVYGPLDVEDRVVSKFLDCSNRAVLYRSTVQMKVWILPM